nr:metabotropic glutamate receptor 4-like [Biomphalaria glabrata]
MCGKVITMYLDKGHGDINLLYKNFEMTRTLRSSGSFSSGYSRSTNATQTYSNGHSISTQTLDSVGDPRFGDDDVEL